MSASALALAAPQAAVPVRRAPLGAGHLLRLSLADMRERMRRPAFLVSILVMIWLGQHMLPQAGAGYRTCVIAGDYRPYYDSAWVGTLTALLTSVFFLFVGFYQIKGSVERDRRTGVGQILAAARVGKRTYLVAKTISNAAVLLSMATVTLLAAMATQLLLAETPRFDPGASAGIFYLLTVPVALCVSAGAVLFECVPFLAKGLGNIVWFFLISAVLSSGVMDRGGANPYRDLIGGTTVLHDVVRVCREAYPQAKFKDGDFSMGVNISKEWKGHSPQRFVWPGLEWNRDLMLSRVAWAVVAIAIAFMATIPFDRFSRTASARAARPALSWWERFTRPAQPRASVAVAPSRLTIAPQGFRFDAVLRAELAILLGDRGLWWWLGVLGFSIAGLAAPPAALRAVVLPLASLWPVLVWSSLGNREQVHGTGALLFSCPRPVSRLLPAAWLAGACVFVVIGATAMLRLAIAGDWPAIAAWLLGAAFVPALAIVSGVWTGTSKFFEVAYLFLWYIGPMHHVEWFDYTGVSTPRSAATWAAYAALTAGLCALAWEGRARQVRR